MSTNSKKIEKHLGEQVPLMSNDQGSGNQNPKDKPNNSQTNSNEDINNPLKPQETQKSINNTDIEKK